MDFYENVVVDYLRADRSVFVNTECCIQLNEGNNANFRAGNNYTIWSPYYMTEVGEFENSESPYGTFDQGGNVYEWHEAVIEAVIGSPYRPARGLRGSAWSYNGGTGIQAWWRQGLNSTKREGPDIGFRIAMIPEPTTFTLVLAALCLAMSRRRAF